MLEKKDKLNSVLYLHGRPSAHALHSSLARSITNQFKFIDEPIRWQDKKYPGVLNLFIWIVNAICFKNKKKYDLFLLDNLHITPVFMRALRLITKNQKLVAHMGSHTLYFMYAGKFSRINIALHKWALQRYDAIICEGKMAEDFCKHLLKEKCPPTYVTFLGPLTKRIERLIKCTPDFKSHNILIIAHGPGEFRKFYKGLDIMIAAFYIAWKENPKLELNILGTWDQAIIQECLNGLSDEAISAIHFQSNRGDLEHFFNNSALCLHCSRGDAFPTSTIEAMTAGLPTLLSDLTGTKDITTQIDLNLIAPLDIHSIASQIIWYFSLPEAEKQLLSGKGREIAKNFTEEKAIVHYQQVFNKIIEQCGL